MKRNIWKKLICAACVSAIAIGIGSVGAAAAEIDLDESVGAELTSEAVSDPEALPESYSSLDFGYVTSVKSQEYNSCWAYASMATFESLLLRNGIGTVNDSMSTNHLNLWATTRSNGKGWIREYTYDAYPVTALGYLTSWQGGVYESDLGDFPLNSGLTGNEVPTDLARYGVTSVKYLNKNDPDEIKRCIRDYGGVYSSFALAASCRSQDKVSYYMPPGYSGGYSGHSIEVVGWDDNYAAENFTGSAGTPDNPGAWLIKNSYGTNYGDSGYFWISYEDAYLFSKKYVPSYSITGFEEITEDKKLIQNEIYGATYEFKYAESNDLTFINRLHFDTEFNKIDKVVFKTDALGADYRIFYVPDGSANTPDANTANWTLLYEGTADYTGYICADIEDFEYSDSEGSVAVEIDTSSVGGNSTIGVGEWLTSSTDYVFINESQHGESYLMQDGQITDVMDWYHDNLDDDIGGTFVIKAVTVKDYSPTLLGDVDRNGVVTIRDVTEIQRHLAEFITLTGINAANADYDGDGEITINDATKIQRFLAEYTD